MPRSAPAPFPTTYQHLLDLLTDNAMTLTRLAAAELHPEDRPPAMPYDAIARIFAVMSATVRRSIVVSRHIDTLPVPIEEKQGRIMPVLDRVLAHFAKNKVDIETYNAMVDAELDGELDEELALDGDYDEDEYDRVDYDPDADVPGRQPCVLVGELCRDFGLVARLVPPHWLETVPADLTVLATRAATAAIRPGGKPDRVGHLMER